MRTNKSNKTKVRKILELTSILLVLIVLAFFQSKPAFAAQSIAVKEINYYNSTITLQVNEGDSIVYLFNSTKKTWEEVPGSITSVNTLTMDISWVSTLKNHTILLKGSSSTSVLSITLPKQVNNFKASFNKVKGTVTFGNAGTRKIEWRKKDTTTWNEVNTNTLSSELSRLYNNGATLYFRLAPVNGTSDSSVGNRASKEVAVSVPKKLNAPSIKVDGSEFSISIKKGMAYRIVNSDGSMTDWINITNKAKLLLENVAAKAMHAGATNNRSAVTMQFKTNATGTSQVSKIATVTIPIQEGAPDEINYGMSLSYTSSSSLSLQVKAASSTTPFEYTVIKEDEELNYQTAKWTTISSNATIKLNSVNAPNKSHIYVRKKSITETDTTAFTLASVETDLSGAGGVIYPGVPTATSITTLINTAGVCKASKSASYLSFVLYSPTSTTVSGINFLDSYGIDKGSVTFKSSVATNTNSVGINDRFIITTKITSTDAVDSVTEELLYAKITLANSEVITSTETAGILLYLYPSSAVNNPANADNYASNFERVYLSKEAEDDTYFKFQLDLGTPNVIDTSSIGKFTSQTTAINSIKYDGYTLMNNTDYTVEYGSYVNDDDITIAKATVTVNVAQFEKSSLIDITDQSLPLIINLNNNELLEEAIYIILRSTATIDVAPIAWSITEGSLKETATSTITNADNSTTTTTEEVISFSIALTLFDKNYEVGIADVTWGDSSIFSSAIVSNGKVTIYLSNAKINKLNTDTTDTKNIVFTLSNGYVIKKGCKLTILNNSQQ